MGALNVSAPFGFRPVRRIGGGPIVLNEYSIASGYSTALYQGRPVILTGTGTNLATAVGSAGTPSTNTIGIFAGVTYTDSQNRKVWSTYWPASATTFDGTDAVAMVWDQPDLILEAQGNSTGIAKADIGALVEFTAAAGSSITGVDGSYLNNTTATTGKTYRLLRLAPKIGNDYGAYAIAEVSFAQHALLNVVSGVGGV